MATAWAWARVELRAHLVSFVAIALLIGVSLGVALTALAGARRADTAFQRFAEESRTATHRVQYSSRAPIDDEVVRRLREDPAVEAAVPLYLAVGLSEDSEYDIGIASSPDAALLREVDRPRLLEGRLPALDAPDEVIINEFQQRTMGVSVGDRIHLSTFSVDQLAEQRFDEELAGPPLELTVVGVGRLPDDLADGESSMMLAGPAFHDAARGRVGQFGPTIELILAPGADARRIVDEALRGFPLEETTEIESLDLLHDRVRDGTRVLATGLALFGACAALAGLVASAQALNRRLAAAGTDQTVLAAMGFTRGQRRTGILLLAAPVLLLGGATAVATAIVGSAWMPIGSARRAEPSPGIDIDGGVLGLGALVAVTLLALGAGLAAWRLTTSHAPSLRPSTAVAPLRASVGATIARRAGWSPAAVLGITLALEPGRGRTAVPVRPALVSAVAGIAGVVAALTFSSSLDHLVSTPSAYGWNWSLSPDLFEGDAEALAERDEIRDVGLALFRQTAVNGQPVDGVAVEAVKGSPSLTVLDGRMPANRDEVALGPKTLDELGLRIGDDATVATNDDPSHSVAVVGEVLFPVFDQNAFNAGAAFHPDLIEAVELSDGFGGALVGLQPGIGVAEGAAVIDEVAPGSMTVYAYPSKPSDVANLDQVRGIPMALAGFLVLIGAAAVGHALITSVRRRRLDIGIVRSLGFQRRQVLATVGMQSATLVGVGLLLGVPLGVMAGRAAWTLVAGGLGVGTAPTLPILALSVISPVALVVAVAIAWMPAEAATRVRAAEALRAE